jgi:hypothetical protein
VLIVLWLAYLDFDKLEVKLFAGVVFDRSELFECFSCSFFKKPFVGVELGLNEVGGFDTGLAIAREELLLTHRALNKNLIMSRNLSTPKKHEKCEHRKCSLDVRSILPIGGYPLPQLFYFETLSCP